jgi:hypothetical protein
MGAGFFAAWRAHSEHGTLPRPGGWEAQPLAVLVRFQVLDLLEQTWRYYRAKNADLSKLTRLQLDLIAWLEED